MKIVVFLLMCTFCTISFAGSFSDGFKDWLLGSEANASVSTNVNLSTGLDKSSKACIQCHDGNEASHIVVKSAGSQRQYLSSGIQSNHPVGMTYDVSVSQDPRRYRPRASLNSAIKLVNGQVGCLSCHVEKTQKTLSGVNGAVMHTASQQTGGRERCSSTTKLTVSKDSGSLCMSCHAM